MITKTTRRVHNPRLGEADWLEVRWRFFGVPFYVARISINLI